MNISSNSSAFNMRSFATLSLSTILASFSLIILSSRSLSPSLLFSRDSRFSRATAHADSLSSSSPHCEFIRPSHV